MTASTQADQRAPVIRRPPQTAWERLRGHPVFDSFTGKDAFCPRSGHTLLFAVSKRGRPFASCSAFQFATCSYSRDILRTDRISKSQPVPSLPRAPGNADRTAGLCHTQAPLRAASVPTSNDPLDAEIDPSWSIGSRKS